MPVTVDTEAEWVKKEAPMWTRAADLLGGTDAMRAAGEAYLPRFTNEPDDHYNTRKKSSVLTNFYRAMARDIKGVMTASKITVDGSKLDKEFLENVDRQGRDIHSFAANMLFTLLTKGAFHILTDYPKNPGVQTLDQQQKAGLRPYWAAINPEAIVDAVTEMDAGTERITHVRWKESGVRLNGFERACVDKIRVLQLKAADDPKAGTARKGEVEYEVWSRSGQDAYARTEGPTPLVAEGLTALTEITFVPVLADRRDNWRSVAPLDDVAHKNIEHWRSSSDQRNILTVSRFPIMFQVGTANAIKVTGPGMTLHSIGKQSADGQDVQFDYIEPEGKGIEAGERDLKAIQEDAEMIGIRLMARPTQRTKADAQSDQAKDQSPLQELAGKLEEALTKALGHVALWYGKPAAEGGKAIVPRDFGLSAEDAAAINAMLQMRKTGDLSQITLWAEMRARGYLKTQFTDKEELQRLENERAATGMEGADPFADPSPKKKPGEEDDEETDD